MLLCYILRHHPEYINIKLDQDGFADIQELASKISDKFPHGHMSKSDIIRIASDDVDGRFLINLDQTMIKARYGHSIRISQSMDPYVVVPAKLYHGTINEHMDSILKVGLLRGSRNHVHLCKTPDMAWKKAGRHKHGDPVVIEIDSLRMQNEKGPIFYKANDEIVLVEHVPAQYINTICIKGQANKTMGSD